MDGLESFLKDASIDPRRNVDGVAAAVLQKPELIAAVAAQVASADGPDILERALYVSAVAGTKSKEFGTAFLDKVPASALVEIINKYKEHVGVQKKLMYFISVLAVEDSSREKLLEGGVGEAAIAVINAHMRNDVVLERACMALSRLTLRNVDYKLRLAAAGGLRSLVAVLDKHGAQSSLMVTVSIVIRNMIHNCPENSILGKQLSIPKALLDMTRSFSKEPQVQSQLLLTLVTMKRGDEDLNRILGTDERFISPIVNAVKSSEDNKTLSELSVELLACIASGRNEETLNRLGEDNLIPLLCRRLTKFEDSAILAEQICSVLRALAFTRKNRELLRTEGGILSTISTMRRHFEEAAVVEQGLCVLSNCCFSSPENQELIGKSSGVEETVRVMEIHRDKEKIQDCGCRALRNFANQCEYNIRLEGDLGVINCLTLAMMSFPTTASVNEQAVAALLNLARLDQNTLRMVEQDVTEVIHRTLQNIDSEELNKLSTKLINILETPTTSNVESSLTRSLSRGLSRSLSRGTSVSLSRAKTEQMRERGMSRRISRMRSQSIHRNKEEVPADVDGTLKSALSGLKRAVSARARD